MIIMIKQNDIYRVINLKITMKNTINFTDYLNTCLKRDPSLKSTAHLKMGLTVNTFHANTKPNKKHCRTKTDQLFAPESMSTTAVFVEGKLKSYGQQRLNSRKTNSQAELKKTNSHKTLQSAKHMKSSSIYKSNGSKDSRQQTQTVRSLQKLRKDLLNKTNPEVVSQQLKQITNNDKKNVGQGTIANEYYLLSNQLLDTIKMLQKKHSSQISSQKQTFEKREQKILQKMMEIEKKNQRCTTLINQLRIRNIDVDTIWHEQKLNTKTNELISRK